MSEQTGTYSFIPWIRRGLSNHVNAVADASGTPTVSASVTINNGTSSVTSEPIDFSLAGPGDVIGIQKSSVINTSPLPGDNNFEAYNFPFIEFYEEDFPWRYTPHRVEQERLTPWVTLLVLENSEFTLASNTGAPLPVIRVTNAAAFPNPTTLWAWAHVHTNVGLKDAENSDGLDTNTFLNGALKSNPDLAFSRLLSPRRLKPGASYTAFLIPTFEAGRSAGAGEGMQNGLTGDAVAWTGLDVTAVGFPVYHQWEFRTGNETGFEYAVRQLQSLNLQDIAQGNLAETKGRKMVISNPGYGLEPVQDSPNGEVPAEDVLLEGVLQIPNANPDEFLNINGFAGPLRELLNLNSKRVQESYSPASDEPVILQDSLAGDPVVTPPLYGRWHANVDELEAPATGTVPNWLQQINLDPRYRAIAGIGSRIVQKNQEEYVRMAWEQLDDILSANSFLRELQAGAKVGQILYNKYLLPFITGSGTQNGKVGLENTVSASPDDNALLFMAPALSRVQISAEGTAEGNLRDSKVPLAVFEGAFRKLIPKKDIQNQEPVLLESASSVEETTTSNFISKLNAGDISAGGERPAVLGYSFDETLNVLDTQGEISELFISGSSTAMPLSDVAKLNLSKALQDLPDSLVTSDGIGNLVENLPAIVNSTIAASEPLAAAVQKKQVAISGDNTYSLPASTLESTSSISATEASGISQIVKHPYFKQPMYEVLKDFAEELFLPGISEIPQNTVSLLQVNQRFIEAFMVGLNHEMAAELLWREFPTDQRGTFFRQFWDTKDHLNATLSEEEKTDIKPIHQWSLNTKLGMEHQVRDTSTGGSLALLIRGELLRKFPNTIIFAQEVIERDGQLVLDGAKKFPTYRADLVSDITILMFELDAATAKSGYGWYFVFGERPGQPTFGLTLNSNAALPSSWEEFSWQHLPAGENLELSDFKLASPSNGEAGEVQTSADFAAATFNVPAMVAIAAADLII